ncbi:MAG TPA: hypothetical protein PK954_04560, partial [Anaerolineales bacterium]|nr:hypothetical protein [Anaerolineales bacterium]
MTTIRTGQEVTQQVYYTALGNFCGVLSSRKRFQTGVLRLYEKAKSSEHLMPERGGPTYSHHGDFSKAGTAKNHPYRLLGKGEAQMPRKLHVFASLLMVISFVLSACGPAATTVAPTAAPAEPTA